MGERLSTEDLTGRRPATQVDENERTARPELEDTDGAPVRSPLSDPNRAAEAPHAAAAPDRRRTDDRRRPQRHGRGQRAAARCRGGHAGFERRWHQVQVAFVDEPRAAVEQADELVAELMRGTWRRRSPTSAAASKRRGAPGRMSTRRHSGSR